MSETDELKNKLEQAIALADSVHNLFILIKKQREKGRINLKLYGEVSDAIGVFNGMVKGLNEDISEEKEEYTQELCSFAESMDAIELPDREVLEYSDNVLEMLIVKIEGDIERSKRFLTKEE
ncbi:MAG: hypothetical protein HQK96_07030 [Nitrospirae bacterium]|nr:hypothetical protein [Nitrospirota bacterium]